MEQKFDWILYTITCYEPAKDDTTDPEKLGQATMDFKWEPSYFNITAMLRREDIIGLFVGGNVFHVQLKQQTLSYRFQTHEVAQDVLDRFKIALIATGGHKQELVGILKTELV